MPTQSKSSKAKSTKTKAASNGTVASQASRAERARNAAESVVDVPVGLVLEVSDRVTELVDPFTGRDSAEKELKSYRTSLRRSVKRTERRGHTARRKATTEARKTRNRVEREARKRRRTVETSLKRNRKDVEKRVREVSERLTSLR
jgi:hypothetical protein